MRSLYWFRNDLRLHDNATLSAFCNDTESGVCLWTPSPSYMRAGKIRKAFVDACVNSLHIDLQKNGQALQISEFQIETELVRQIEEHKIERLYYTREFAHEELETEASVQKLCDEKGVQVIAVEQSTLVLERDLPFDLAALPLVFTEFRKKVEAKMRVIDLIASPRHYPRLLSGITQTSRPAGHASLELSAGEAEAQIRLQDYLWNSDSIQTYKETRNGLLGLNDSSRLSPWLNQGCLSARQVYHELGKYEQQRVANESTYWLVFELLWRDYFKFLSRKIGNRLFKLEGLNSHRAVKPVREGAQDRYLAWSTGKTADSFVNANMNELNETGWMSNRGRQNVASYLIHQLQLPWTWGASHFEKMLFDYDPDLNWGNWLYLSGRGTDPRARVFNTALQAKMYDPDRTYQKKWSRS